MDRDIESIQIDDRIIVIELNRETSEDPHPSTNSLLANIFSYVNVWLHAEQYDC